ncbi:hypothetical protein ALQ04_04089 [Pseudomonas cichorii]|uniref:Lipoprotein n=1 Tax=Pseudomonas cichorii TaxID=36746 RepID=A0A3M4M3K1_PSECI|nr:hypothetical protein [Pseudomonas cichorii]RMQ47771.1 hypothetical protein ALQ04_04089 [Pseudomonas cichorii]
MKCLFLGAVLGALSWSAFAMSPVENSSPPGSLEAYIGKYPWEKVNGTAFIEDPRVQAAVARAAPTDTIREAVLGEDMISPILKVGNRLLAAGWDSRSGGSTNWAILATLDGRIMALCYYQEFEDERAYWYINREIVARFPASGGCPSEEGDIKDMGTFPVDPIPGEDTGGVVPG